MELSTSEEAVMRTFSWLVGRVLTQIEAAIPDKVQRNSLKKLVEGQIYEARKQLLRDLEYAGQDSGVEIQTDERLE